MSCILCCHSIHQLTGMSDFRTLDNSMVPQHWVDLTLCFLSTAQKAASTHMEAALLGHWAGLLFHFPACFILPIFHCTLAGSSSSHTARGYQLITSLSFKTTQKNGETKWVKTDVDRSCCFLSYSWISCSLRGRVKILSVVSGDEHEVHVRRLGFQFWPWDLLTENTNFSGFSISIFTN